MNSRTVQWKNRQAKAQKEKGMERTKQNETHGIQSFRLIRIPGRDNKQKQYLKIVTKDFSN